MIMVVNCGIILTMLTNAFCRLRLLKLIAGFMLIFTICLAHTHLFADDYTDALKRAKTENKPIVLYFYSNYCGYCDAMDKEVLADKDIVRTLKNDLVFLRINVDKKADLASKFNVRGYPTTSLLEPSGKGIVQIPGYIDKKNYSLVLAYLKGNHYKAMRFGEYIKKTGAR
ncbi:MAG: hypothetical protein C0392_06120 [Syntrophus sp. (in: bacteria)]|nr:hypothetical protein [Syntrophus sp. (in: bacteria)]